MTEQAAEFFYRRAMEKEQSPKFAAEAREDFSQAAHMGHKEAVSAYAHYLFSGHGGPQDQERALLLLWSPFEKSDPYYLEQLADILNSYAEISPESAHAIAAVSAAEKLEKIKPLLESVSYFMHEVRRDWHQRYMASMAQNPAVSKKP